MWDILQIFFYISIILIIFPFGFSVILLSKETQENWIAKSFLYGTAVLTIGAYWLSYIYRNGLGESAKFFFLLSLIGMIVLYVRKRQIVAAYFKNIVWQDIINFALCCILGAVPLLLIVVFGAQFPYIDGYTYICNADYLMDYGYKVDILPEDTMLHPWLSQTMLYQDEQLRIGAQMLLALFSGLFNVEFSLEMFMPITAYAVFLCGMAAWTFTSKRYCEVKLYKTIAIVLVVTNVPIVLWNALYGFLPQTFGTAMALGALGMVLDIDNWKKHSRWYILSSATLFSGCALCYNEMLPFIALSILIFCVRFFVVYKDDRKRIIIYIGCCGLAAMGYIFTYIFGMIRATLSQLKAVVGWHQDKDINTYLSYFLSTVPAEYNFRAEVYSVDLLCYEIFTIAMFVLLVSGIRKSKKSARWDFLYVSIPYILILFYFMFFTENPFIGGKGNSWSIYKLMQYFFVVAIPYIAIYLSEALKKINQKVVIILLVLFAAYNVNNAVIYMDKLSQGMEGFVEKSEESIYEYYKLYEKYGHSEERLILYNVPDKHRQMITYFLKEVELVSDWNEDPYFSNVPELQEEMFEEGIPMSYDATAEGNVAGLVGKEYELLLGEGFYEFEEFEGNYWNWSNKESVLKTYCYSKKGELFLEFEIFTFEQKQEEELCIYADGNKLLKTIRLIPNKISNVSITIPNREEELTFYYSGEAKCPPKDEREVAFAIRNYQLKMLGE